MKQRKEHRPQLLESHDLRRTLTFNSYAQNQSIQHNSIHTQINIQQHRNMQTYRTICIKAKSFGTESCLCLSWTESLPNFMWYTTNQVLYTVSTAQAWETGMYMMFKTEETVCFFPPTLIPMFSNCFDVWFHDFGDIYPLQFCNCILFLNEYRGWGFST